MAPDKNPEPQEDDPSLRMERESNENHRKRAERDARADVTKKEEGGDRERSPIERESD